MEQLIAHLLGDYVLQNHWMAVEKTKRWFPAILHALLYGLPFLLLVDSWEQWLVIVVTHAPIDRYRLVRYWLDFWGVGKPGWLLDWWMQRRGYELDYLDPPPVWTRLYKRRVYQFSSERGTIDETETIEFPSAPPFLGVWLLIIADNTLHLAINYGVLRWL